MKTGKFLQVHFLGWFWITAAAWLLQLSPASAELEQTFDQLQIGTQTYKNVTVTTKSKAYVFILHSAGMTNIRVSDLPDDVREKLGYADPTIKPKTNNAATAWAKQTFSKLQTTQVKGVEEKLAGAWRENLSPAAIKLPTLTTQLIATVAAGLLVVYFFFCYCCMLICQKTGHNPSVLIFVPWLQLLPLLKAAQMSGWWLVAFLVPGINLIGQLVWSVKIVKARSKSGWLALWLVFPLTSLLAFLYLAFSSGTPEPKKAERRVEIMTLETA